MKRFGAVAVLVCLFAGTGCYLNPLHAVGDAICVMSGHETEDQEKARIKAEKKAEEQAEKEAKARAKAEAKTKRASE